MDPTNAWLYSTRTESGKRRAENEDLKNFLDSYKANSRWRFNVGVRGRFDDKVEIYM